MYGLPDSQRYAGLPAETTTGISEGPPTGILENYASASRSFEMQNVMGGGGIMEEKLAERRKMIKDLTGEDFPVHYVYPEVADGVDGKEVTPSADALRRYGQGGINAKTGYQIEGAKEQLSLAIMQEKRIEELRKAYPSIPSYRSLVDQAKTLLEDNREEDASIARRGGTGTGVARFFGNISGNLQDPFTQATLPFGGFGKTVVARIGSEALVQAGLQLANQYAFVKPMKESFAQPFSDKEALLDSVYAGVGGALFRGGVEAAPGVISGIKSVPQYVPAKARAIADRLDTLAGKDTRLGRLAASLTGAKTEQEAAQVLRSASPRDVSDLLDHADENPTLTPKMAMAAAEPEIVAAEAQPRGMDWSEHMTRANDVAGAMETQTPLPAYEPTPGNVLGTDLPAVRVRDLLVDADRFQYKSGGDTQGVTERLRGVSEWNPEAAGNISVWESADGKRYVADGHQRVGLAKRIMGNQPETDIRIPAYVYREADGYTAAEARALAAIKNIGQGSGSALDAARVFKDMPEKEAALKRILPPHSELVKQGRALMNLSDEGLSMVDQGVIPENYAAIVGNATADHATQLALLKVLQRAEPDNAFQAAQIVRQALAEDIDKTTVTDLFGERTEMVPLYADKAKVLDLSLKQIRKERSALNNLIKNDDIVSAYGNQLNLDATKAGLDGAGVLQYVVQKQAFTKGIISDLLTTAAREVSNGTRHATAARQFVQHLREQIRDAGAASLLRDGSGDAAAVKQAFSEIAQRERQDLFSQAVADTEKAVEPKAIESKYEALTGAPREGAALTPEESAANEALARAADDEMLPLGELHADADGNVTSKLISMGEIKRDIADDDALLASMQECLL